MSGRRRPLSPRQHRAAHLLGQGWQQRQVAAEVGVTPKTVQRWRARRDFDGVFRQRREAALEAAPTAKATLEAALSATNGKGEPDWRVRVGAAQTLLLKSGPIDGPGETRETRIYLRPGDDDAG